MHIWDFWASEGLLIPIICTELHSVNSNNFYILSRYILQEMSQRFNRAKQVILSQLVSLFNGWQLEFYFNFYPTLFYIISNKIIKAKIQTKKLQQMGTIELPVGSQIGYQKYPYAYLLHQWCIYLSNRTHLIIKNLLFVVADMFSFLKQ